jgi:hypothetical protein
LRILCATVLLSLGLAHHLPLVVAATSPELAEDYRLPDGSFASLCGGAGDSDHRLAPGGLCEACVLAASFILPPPNDVSWLRTERAMLSSALFSRQPVLHGALLPVPRSRGPPILA